MTSEAPKISLYNTLTKSKAPFVPLDANNVRMYVCGPTVYDFAHIGNARPVIVFDVLFRLLRHVYGDAHVNYVRNITDVDDKINARAARDFPGMPLNEAIAKVTETTAARFQSDALALGCLEPTHQPRATDNIAEMQTIIATLLEKKNAYLAGGEVLFDTTSMADYGKLSGRNLDEQQAGARIAVEAHKRNPGDFVLWKLSSDNEPGWESPWGVGRPGWHIECSAMAERYLGKEFDIHGGGIDLSFPHHENELAQSRCAHDTKTMSQVWMHNGFLQVEGEKMSKSVGNFITIAELLETEKFGGRTWPGQVLRLAMLMTHYRDPIDFSVARLSEAQSILKSWLKVAQRYVPELGEIHSDVIRALSDDLNFHAAKMALDKLILQGKSAEGTEKLEKGRSLAATLIWLGLAAEDDFDAAREDQLEIRESLRVAKEKTEHLDTLGKSLKWIEQLMEVRLEALNAKDFAKADEIRAGLLEQGIQLMDSKDPDTGERRTKWEMKR